jgi:hypothetical protein
MNQGAVHAIDSHVSRNVSAKGLIALPSQLRPGLSMMAVCLALLAVAVTALAATGAAQAISVLMVAVWVVLVPAALFFTWAGRALSVLSASFILLVLATLPFNSPVFIANIWAAVTMFIMSFPRPR